MDVQLSVIINVKNGERTLERCLASLHKFTDIVVFDNYSKDRTIEIARSYSNVTIVQHEFCGMGQVRNLAAAHAKHDWLLVIDSDEVLHPDLADSLLNLVPTPGTIYSLLRHNFYANMWVNSSAWENDWVLRLYNRKETQYTKSEVHESIIREKMVVVRIDSGFIYHFPYNEVSQLIDKMQTYSSWYAKDNYPNKRPNLWLIPFRAFFMFIKCYVLKRGFLDGFNGFIISSYNAVGVFSKYVKLYELYNNSVLGLAFRVDSVEDLVNLSTKINNQKLLPRYTYIMYAKEQAGLDSGLLQASLANKLCMPSKGIPIVAADDWKGQVLNMEGLDYIVYLEDNELLSDTNLLKDCKKNIAAKKHIPKIRLINLSKQNN